MSTSSPAAAKGSTLKTLLVGAVKVVVSGGLLWLLFSKIDTAKLWLHARTASPVWLACALLLYLLMIFASTWRWGLLLAAQHIRLPFKSLVASYLVATFFNNFLPSNIGGDVIRISDTARPAGSKTLATMIVFVDRFIGLVGLVLFAAIGATAAGHFAGAAEPPLWIAWLWGGFIAAAAVSAPVVASPTMLARLLQPLKVLHPEWVGARITRITETIERFRQQPQALLGCFVGSLVVQGVLVGFYLAVAHSMNIPISFWHLAVIVPLSFIVQMLPVSVNGFGVREAIFTFYFARIGIPLEYALVMPLMATAVIMLFSLSGAAVYVTRRAEAGA